MEPKASEEKAAIIESMIAIAGVARTEIDATLRAYGIPASAAAAVRILATADAPITPRDLAHRLDRDPSTASLIADKLEQSGVVKRLPHPSDGRKRVLVLTPEGEAMWAQMRDRVHASALFDGLSAEDRRQLLALLTRMGG